MASPLEVLFLLGNLHAVGLMADGDFQRIKPGLIELIRRSIYHESGADEAQSGLGQFSYDHHAAMEVPPFDEWSSRISDEELWKHVISMFLALKREVEGSEVETSLADFLLPDEDRELKSNADDFEGVFEGDCLPIISRSIQQPGLFSSLELQDYDMNKGANREALAILSKKVDALERKIAHLRGQSFPSDHRDDHAAPHFHPQNAEDERAKKSKIAELQRDLQRELRSAELHASKGETFNAGSAKGRAARIESMLRALGA